jgi:hypothetical protein
MDYMRKSRVEEEADRILAAIRSVRANSTPALRPPPLLSTRYGSDAGLSAYASGIMASYELSLPKTGCVEPMTQNIRSRYSLTSFAPLQLSLDDFKITVADGPNFPIRHEI